MSLFRHMANVNIAVDVAEPPYFPIIFKTELDARRAGPLAPSMLVPSLFQKNSLKRHFARRN
jgi:hypothetical protein